MATPRSFGGFAGARLPLAVAGFAALSSLLALIVGSIWGAFSDGRIDSLAEEVADHQVAGEQALAALDEAGAAVEAHRTALWSERKKAVSFRATELALFGTMRAADARRKTGAATLTLPSSWKLEKNEAVGLIDRANDRVVMFEGIGVAAGSTLSVSLPVLAAAIGSQPKERTAPYTIADQSGAWAVGTPIGGDLYAVARVDLELEVPKADAVDRAKRLVGAIVAPGIAGEGAARPIPYLLLAALLAALGGGLWAWLRVTHPIARSLAAGRDFVHGQSDARADPQQGGREAREIATAINALIDRAERAMEKGRAARGDDLQNAVLAIDLLGKGDLRDSVVPPGSTFGPIAQAIDRARRDLLERVTEMHGAAMQVATRAAELGPASRQIADASAEQLTALRRLESSSEESVDGIRKKGAELEIAVHALTATAAEHRQMIQELRASLSGLSRRVMALRGTAEEAQALATRADSIDQALVMLSRLAGQSDSTQTKTRATALVGDARAALAEIGDKLKTLEQEMLRAAHGLEIMAQSQPEAPKMFEASVTQPFYDAIAILVRTVEVTVGCLAALERSAKTTAAQGDAMHSAARQAVELVPRLGAALSAIRLGTSFEEQLLERLARMKAEVEAAKRTDGLTPDGERMLSEVQEASEAARSKLIRLAQATEAAIRAMRG